MGSGSSRKIRYARLLVEALDLTQMPGPLDLVLAHVSTFSDLKGAVEAALSRFGGNATHHPGLELDSSAARRRPRRLPIGARLDSAP